MKIFTRTTALLLALAVLLALGGGTGMAANGKYIRLKLDNEVSSLDPHVATDVIAYTVIRAFSVGLYQSHSSGVPEPGLIKDAKKSDDGLVYTYTLKEGKWSSGHKVTAHDFVFAWRELVDPANGFQYQYILKTAGVANAAEIIDGKKKKEELGVKALGDQTLEITLERPLAYFEHLLIMPSLLPVNEEFYRKQGDKYGTSPETTNSNGPFRLTSYQPSAVSITLEKNPDYVDADKVKLDGVQFQVIKDNQQTTLAYQNNDLDVVALGGEQVELFRDDPEYTPVLTGALWFIPPNLKTPGLDNLNLRRALATSFSKDVLVGTVLKDGSVPADYVVTKKTHVTAEGKDLRELTSDFLKTNKEQAKADWEKAKAELGTDKFTFTILVEDSEDTINAVQFIQAQIQETLPGITIKIEQMPKKNRVDRMTVGDYELGLTRWGPDYPDATTYLDLFTTDNRYNYGRWSNAEYDTLVAAIGTTLSNNIPARLDAIKRAEQIIGEEAAIFPVYQKGIAYLVSSRLKGITFSSTGTQVLYQYADFK
ncbi:MAG: peptide ABC transporter substrate-binding protein [Synergistaceae bacterium]|jgi:oligopeptide transport system substrate-binding protein|nr:peptide ABC transporter substrate-binding protein [Synergistaceae bacterium]